ncbi:substrate-binding domain-containing protein [Variovorax sp. ZS18.2.2]|uniref:sugar ABC transporter substrate-binding protein n=1 Tax=Variovorax sp. ZS18.2.2 TaxID=2971255 RepID=UPI00215139AE|nr:substrate-binding domain-containing protein [Variovorax sp. ZS18.2.2]MCR6480878.1 substrate-binding domain-containing protein [Variovorax sp. ZS18.2.2]
MKRHSLDRRNLALRLGAVPLAMLGAAWSLPGFTAQEGKRLAIITPYQSSPTTTEMIKSVVAYGATQGWKTNVVDTRGDMGQMVARFEDAVSSKVDAIVVVSIDAARIKAQVKAAQAAKIAVFGCDSTYVTGMTATAVSDDAAMSRLITNRLFEAMGDQGNVVVFTHRPHPGVLLRTNEFFDLLKQHPKIKLLTEKHVDVPGPIESARKSMESLLLANPQKGSIVGVWTAFDDAAIGATQAIMAAGRNEIVVTGVDGATQAVDLIRKKSPLVATVKQDFVEMGRRVGEQITRSFNGQPATATRIDVPAKLLTAANLS